MFIKRALDEINENRSCNTWVVKRSPYLGWINLEMDQLCLNMISLTFNNATTKCLSMVELIVCILNHDTKL